jgi:1-deoxy-D-xylulose-5-phosphate synthase
MEVQQRLAFVGSVASKQSTWTPCQTDALKALNQCTCAQLQTSRRRAARTRSRAALLRCAADDGSLGESHSVEYTSAAPLSTPLLDAVRFPADMRQFTVGEVKQLAHELRWELLRAVSKTGGHLGASLGVVELTVALHYVFNTPEDAIVWDVSHQTYPHKILTGRRHRMHTLRKSGGISGFTRRVESEYDVFGAGHSSTSISAALGLAIGRDLAGKKQHVIAVIGDGALTGGMAYEAMNNAGYLNSRIIVILNDNGQVSLPTGTKSAAGTGPAGALSGYMSRLLTSKEFQDVRAIAKEFSRLFPDPLQRTAAQLDEYARAWVAQGAGGNRATLFEELGFYYVGPVDGHDVEVLVNVLKNIRDAPGNKPIFLHVKTEKGRGYPPAESALDKYHGVSKFDLATGKQMVPMHSPPSYTSVFAKALIAEADEDRRIVGITAAMPGGTGMGAFGEAHPTRCFDVGIAEQHAVTFAAGLSIQGFKPFCCIYSTFLQRGYDQVIHDVALQKLPVRFILDRAGLVGNDGPTHHGTFDLAYLGCIPNMMIMAPSDEIELVHMVATARAYDEGPCALRYPRGTAVGLDVLREHFGYDLEAIPVRGKVLPIGKGRIIREKKSASTADGAEIPRGVAILSLGTRLLEAVHAAGQLEALDVACTVADARFMKPLDTDLIRRLIRNHEVLITIEEGSIGGFGDHVLHYAALNGLLDEGKCKMRPMVIPDVFIETGTQAEQYEEAGLTAAHIVRTALQLVGKGNLRFGGNGVANPSAGTAAASRNART